MSIELSDDLIKKLDFIDSCRERFSVEDNKQLKLPQIIAVGDQSSGKSSILEAISGIKLPKGQNIVTKRPIVVRMRRSEKEKCTVKWGTNLQKVNRADVEKTIRTNQGNDVIKEPIYVNVFAPDVLPLTIIDLPGIVKQAVNNQSENIVQDTKDVSRHYMLEENSLIICVIPASSDFSTIDTLTFASECDKDKSRTIGVLTKMDKLADEEILAKVGILKNISKPLKKGYYGLILADSVLSMDGNDRESEEKKLFLKKGELWDKCYDHLGLKAFTAKLVDELKDMIKVRLPVLKTEMDAMLKVTEGELESLEGICTHQPSQRKHLIEIKDEILKQCEEALIKGRCKLNKYEDCVKYLKDKSIIIDTDEHSTFLFGQHKIFQSLKAEFTKLFKKNFKLTNSKYNVKNLQTLSERCSTEHIHIFLSSEPFKEIVKDHLLAYEEDSINCLDISAVVADTLIKTMIDQNTNFKVHLLKNVFKDLCATQLNKQKYIAKDRIETIFRSEIPCYTQLNLVPKEEKEVAYESTSTKAPELSNIQNKVTNKLSTSASMNVISNVMSKEGDNISLNGKGDSKYAGKILKETLEEYIQNLISRLGDVIPNLIMLTLFKDFHSQLQSCLNTYISSDEVLNYFKNEGEEQKIKELSEKKRALKESLVELTKLLKNE